MSKITAKQSVDVIDFHCLLSAYTMLHLCNVRAYVAVGNWLDITVDWCPLRTDGVVFRHTRITRPAAACSWHTGLYMYHCRYCLLLSPIVLSYRPIVGLWDNNRSGRLFQTDSFLIVRLCCRPTVMRWQIVGSRSPHNLHAINFDYWFYWVNYTVSS